MCLGLNESMQAEPIGRETNTLKISSMNAGLYLNITICLDNCSKGSATFMCLYMVVATFIFELIILCLSFQVIY